MKPHKPISAVPGRRCTDHLDAWRRSPEFREIARQSGRKNVAMWAAAPRCGALAKSTGEPCKLPAMRNGRCSHHGGRTPSGDRWHIPQPGPTPEKTERKIADRIRAAKRRARKIAAMSPEERQQYEKWERTHKPGSAAARKARRLETARNKEIRATLNTAKPAPDPDPELIALQQHRAQLQAEADRLRLEHATPTSSALGAFE